MDKDGVQQECLVVVMLVERATYAFSIIQMFFGRAVKPIIIFKHWSMVEIVVFQNETPGREKEDGYEILSGEDASSVCAALLVTC